MAFTPLLIGSCSEIWGRERVWVVCNAVYISANAIAPVGGMLVGRVVSVARASVGVTIWISSSWSPALSVWLLMMVWW